MVRKHRLGKFFKKKKKYFCLFTCIALIHLYRARSQMNMVAALWCSYVLVFSCVFFSKTFFFQSFFFFQFFFSKKFLKKKFWQKNLPPRYSIFSGDHGLLVVFVFSCDMQLCNSYFPSVRLWVCEWVCGFVSLLRRNVPKNCFLL